ncbi:MAG: glycoside hydrolase family 88 protein [Bacteroidota bacterium]|nr:glycoside hydrolase family 88 protein [Bacteroidota bacterium]MDP4232121.1 glycoside hydrolase family 88 protein [Bacteroidota bacterium]MDP4241171.1 glycoside hydrolase family 88 protein [Bacteroidota bacterium]MDP4286563.1 glycoside hydrolase family 88 protein [Bacteroidota bacterium]
MSKTFSKAISYPLPIIRTVSESFIARYRPESQSTDWGQSLAMYGLLAGLRVDDNPNVRAYLRHWLAFHLAERVQINYFCGSWSIGLLYPDVMREFPEFQIQLRDTALRIYEFIRCKALRNGEGILLHNIDLPNIYIDTVYYSAVVLSKIGPALGLPWEDDAIKQIVLHLDRLQDGEKPFFIHCQENNGGNRSEGSWARGNGWVMMTLAEVLPKLDKKSARYKDLLAVFQKLSSAIALYQTKGGLWRTIIDDPKAYEEVSASAMYLFAYARARRIGQIGRMGTISLMEKAKRGIEGAVDETGRVLGVSEGTWPGTAEYYKSLATGEWWWGTGSFLLAMAELATLDG